MGELGGGCRVVWAAEWRAVKLVVWVRLGGELRKLCWVGCSGLGGKEEEEECRISVEERGSSGALSSLDCSRKKKEALGSSGGAFSCV